MHSRDRTSGAEHHRVKAGTPGYHTHLDDPAASRHIPGAHDVQ
ncbi:MAG TPA: hypothetical protein VEH31_10260 [Streptosporangiaceae bacterium]|nr:hypothetical protein [Streptosporangiaceae bacterium]